jgi:hypothetical protein
MRKLWAIGVLCTLAGCDLPQIVLPQEPTKYHDVTYYDINPIERDRTNAWCGDNPGLATKIPSCDSADASGIKAWHRQMGWTR